MAIWELYDGREIDLLTIDAFEKLPDNTELISIDGIKVIKGKDYIDMDTRANYIAFGIEIKEE